MKRQPEHPDLPRVAEDFGLDARGADADEGLVNQIEENVRMCGAAVAELTFDTLTVAQRPIGPGNAQVAGPRAVSDVSGRPHPDAAEAPANADSVAVGEVRSTDWPANTD